MDSSESSVDILYVDDDEVDIQNALREFKKVNELLQITIARNGIQALDKLYGRNGEEKIIPVPKVIILDKNMPKMDGIEFLKTLRSDPDFNSVSVYILTVSYTAQDKLAMRGLKVAGCIVKPLEHSDALDIFWSIMNERD